MKHLLPLLVTAPLLFTGVLESRAQCSATTGVYDGSPIPGNHYTPFATNTGSPNRRGFRAQYIYPASELLAAGLCPGNISCISFHALEDDLLPGPGNDGITGTVDDTPGCELRIDLRLGHSNVTSFGQALDVSDTAVAGWWDAAVVASPNLNAQWNISTTVHAGWNDYFISGNGFLWNGMQDLVIDLSWQRSAVDGLSPAVQLQEDLPYTATKWVQVTSNFGIDHGNTYSDANLPWGGTTGITNTRPVTRFNLCSLIGVPEQRQQVPFAARWDDAQHAVVITSSSPWSSPRSFRVCDAAGRLLSTMRSAVGQTTSTLPVPSAASGVLFVTTDNAVQPVRVTVVR